MSQLSIVTNPKEVLDEYIYYSSSSKALCDHYKAVVKDNISKFNLKKNDLICDIGSNDGVLIKNYPKNFNNLLGVEPSKAALKMNEKMIPTINRKKKTNGTLKYRVIRPSHLDIPLLTIPANHL